MTTRVAIAIVLHNGCYLVGRRGADAPLAGYCEFPGGKCHSRESPEACVVRECWEETGLAIEVVRLRRDVLHTYPHGTVHLHFFDCRLASVLNSNPIQPNFFWVAGGSLPTLNFPEPNQTLVAELVLDATRCASF